MSASFAVISTGGRQLRVTPGETVKVDHLAAEAGEEIRFDKVLLIETDGDFRIGSPKVEGAVVRARVVDHGRDRKVLVFKRKRRKMYRKSRGHRQSFTLVKIESIEAGS